MSSFTHLVSFDNAKFLSDCDYGSQVRAAHALADLLKRTRPHLHQQVTELQEKVAHCQHTLDDERDEFAAVTQRPEYDGRSAPQLSEKTRAALKELENTTQALLDLRHGG